MKNSPSTADLFPSPDLSLAAGLFFFFPPSPVSLLLPLFLSHFYVFNFFFN
ncbi:hypothetical protein Syun_001744 [Stephania yunnanensis]|uniref:Uncharacterized protein n=1 Tax=Stephania yunnanensis TaxID=152371 RepID=A0AAP0LIF6_9MAGN